MKIWLSALKDVTLASLITLGIYILLSVVLRLIMNYIPGEFFKLLFLGCVTEILFCFCLLYIRHLRREKAEKAFIVEIREQPYGSHRENLRRVLLAERQLLIIIEGIILLSVFVGFLPFLRNPMILFSPLFMLETAFAPWGVNFIGSLLSLLLVPTVYTALLCHRRAKWHEKWEKAN